MKDETYGHTHEQGHDEEVYPAAGSEFSAVVNSNHKVPVVRVRGEVDLATVPELLESIGVAGSRLDGLPIVVVDLRETAFMGVTGVSNLAEQAQAMEGLGGELRVVIPEEGSVARVFGLLGIERMLDLYYELDLTLKESAS